jgi:sodium transport system permease protein
MLETLRDRRTLLVMILLPVLLYPLFGIIMTQAQFAQQKKMASTRFKVGLTGSLLPRELLNKLKETNELIDLQPPDQTWKNALQQGHLDIILKVQHHTDPLTPIQANLPETSATLPSTLRAETQQQVTSSSTPQTETQPSTNTPMRYKLRLSEKHQTRAISTQPASRAIVEEGQDPAAHTEQKLANKQILVSTLGQIAIQVYYSSTQERSRTARQKIERDIKWFLDQVIKLRLTHLNIPHITLKPLDIEAKDVATPVERGRYILSRIFPFILILMTITGAFYPAIDLTAGEKERGTLETLLTAPLKPLEIVAGKYLAVASIATLTGLLNIFSLWLTFAHGMRLAVRPGELSMTLSTSHVFAVFGFLLLVATFAAAFMVAIASLARSFTEAQNFVTPAYFVSFIPIFMTTLPGASASTMTALIPLVNVSYAIRNTLEGTLTSSYLALTLASMAVAIICALKLAAYIFSHEQVLFRENEYSLNNLFSRKDLPSRPHPNISEVMILLGFVFLFIYYIGVHLQAQNIAIGLAVTLWIFVLLPPLIFAHWRKIDFKSAFALHKFPLWTIVGSLLMVLGAIPMVIAFSDWFNHNIFSGWSQYSQQIEQFFSQQHLQFNSAVLFLLLAVSPGICEEFLFRGFVQTAFMQRMRPWMAIFASSLIFAAFHFSIYRLVPTALLGIMIGWICYRSRSLYPAIFTHIAYNGLILLASHYASASNALRDITKGHISLSVIVLCVALLSLGTLIVHRHTSSDTAQ